jgi:hypothetical protein
VESRKQKLGDVNRRLEGRSANVRHFEGPTFSWIFVEVRYLLVRIPYSRRLRREEDKEGEKEETRREEERERKRRAENKNRKEKHERRYLMMTTMLGD